MADDKAAQVQEEPFDFDPDAINKAVADAPDAGFAKVNYGQLTIFPTIFSWGAKGADGKSVKNTRPYKPGDKVGSGEYLEIRFHVNIAEFNPALTFAYERTVRVANSTARDKTDWSEIVLPSLVSVLGDKWVAKCKDRPYVCVEDVPNILEKVSKNTGKVLGVPKFLEVYENALACAAARNARFSGAGTSADANMDAVVDQVRGMLNAIQDPDEVRKLLVGEPFDQYDPDTLIALALV